MLKKVFIWLLLLSLIFPNLVFADTFDDIGSALESFINFVEIYPRAISFMLFFALFLVVFSIGAKKAGELAKWDADSGAVKALPVIFALIVSIAADQFQHRVMQGDYIIYRLGGPAIFLTLLGFEEAAKLDA